MIIELIWSLPGAVRFTQRVVGHACDFTVVMCGTLLRSLHVWRLLLVPETYQNGLTVRFPMCSLTTVAPSKLMLLHYNNNNINQNKCKTNLTASHTRKQKNKTKQSTKTYSKAFRKWTPTCTIFRRTYSVSPSSRVKFKPKPCRHSSYCMRSRLPICWIR